ncbi:uncharacterized protein H6S33_000117 [Morchella sextelata]|uniref:uncharacterized protein n=1 Tax=Morchella sextelata TaxID=1174677 RepID=UPI001D056D07|nr:uncharacterized protein H6S33_000117 [Morchella sextelata]KAH0614481.1 hypothetical protein H6S33_000117 [Morchella sextelata]
MHGSETSMASTGVKQDVSSNVYKRSDAEKPPVDSLSSSGARTSADDGEAGSLPPSYDHTHRKLKPRHIQLIGIGGTIGTALYVNIGRGLMQGGPASLFIAFSLWCTVILAINNSMAEMVTYLPVSSPFIRFAGRYVDDALGFAAGYNFFIFEAALVPFEIVACNVILHYWTDKIHVGIVIAIIIACYALVNLTAVKWYGESEFWMALGKVILIVGLICFTFVTMLGGNPQGDRYGFRYWKDPGPFAESTKTGDVGKFIGFIACLIQASFTIAGPDYVSMAAGEAENPRRVLPRAFNAVFYRLTTFFVLGSLCVGIVVPHNDPTMAAAFSEGRPGAAASPYVVAMDRMGIPYLPHIVNALIFTSALSAGNSYVYCASRSLYGLALEGKAPKILAKCTKGGIPLYSIAVVLAIALLSFLQVSNNAAVVLQWFINLVTASQLINFSVITFTYIKFRKALAAQGISRDTLPHKGFWQPATAWYAFTATSIMCFVGGYSVFVPGNWDVPTFLFSYLMIFLFPVLFVLWKFIHKTKWRAPEEVDLFSDKADIDEYERQFVPAPPRNAFMKYWDKTFS